MAPIRCRKMQGISLPFLGGGSSAQHDRRFDVDVEISDDCCYYFHGGGGDNDIWGRKAPVKGFDNLSFQERQIT